MYFFFALILGDVYNTKQKISTIKNDLKLQKLDLDIPANIIPLGKFDNKFVYYLVEETKKEEISLTYFACDMTSDTSSMIFKTNDCFTVLGSALIKDKIIFAEVQREKLFYVELYTYSLEGVKTKVFEFETAFLPELNVVEENLVISYAYWENEKVMQQIIQINLMNKEKRIIKEAEYVVNGTFCTGILLDGIKATEEGVLFQQIIFENDEMFRDESGKTEIVFYDNKKKKDKILFKLPFKVCYIGGSEDYIITNQYAYAMPLDETGKIYSKMMLGYMAYTISDISSVNDIKDSWVFEKNLIIQSFYNTYIVDMKSLETSVISDTKYSCINDCNLIICRNNGDICMLDLR